ISITNITQQAQFPTNPGAVSVPGGYGRSLGVFVSESRVFTDRELARPINSMTVTNLSQPRPAWEDIDGDGQGDKVDLTNSALLKGFTIHIDEEIDYGVLQQTRDDDLANDYSLLGFGPQPGPDFTAYWPGAYGQDLDGDGTLDYGDIFGQGQLDHQSATPNGVQWGRGDTFSLTTTRLSIRDTRQVYHIGANSGQTIITDFGNMKAETLGLAWSYRAEGVIHDGRTKLLSGSRTQNLKQYLSVQTQDDAEHAIDVIDKAMDIVSKKRSELGAFESSLEKNVYYLSIAEENTQAAESRIRDVDMAKEMTEFTKNQVLMQSGTSMLAQANQKPQSILQLLQ
ncbi:MAG: flagellin, partial [Candidatus Muiribacteriaceae bacterium]